VVDQKGGRRLKGFLILNMRKRVSRRSLSQRAEQTGAVTPGETILSKKKVYFPLKKIPLKIKNRDGETVQEKKAMKPPRRPLDDPPWREMKSHRRQVPRDKNGNAVVTQEKKPYSY